MKTTFEMDGLFTEEDIANRFKVMMQCLKCNKWTLQDREDRKKLIPCENCGAQAFDFKTQVSIRTFNPYKKKTTRKQEKESGQ